MRFHSTFLRSIFVRSVKKLLIFCKIDVSKQHFTNELKNERPAISVFCLSDSPAKLEISFDISRPIRLFIDLASVSCKWLLAKTFLVKVSFVLSTTYWKINEYIFCPKVIFQRAHSAVIAITFSTSNPGQ